MRPRVVPCRSKANRDLEHDLKKSDLVRAELAADLASREKEGDRLRGKVEEVPQLRVRWVAAVLWRSTSFPHQRPEVCLEMFGEASPRGGFGVASATLRAYFRTASESLRQICSVRQRGGFGSETPVWRVLDVLLRRGTAVGREQKSVFDNTPEHLQPKRERSQCQAISSNPL